MDLIRVRVGILNISSGGRCWECVKKFFRGEGWTPPVKGVDNSLVGIWDRLEAAWKPNTATGSAKLSTLSQKFSSQQKLLRDGASKPSTIVVPASSCIYVSTPLSQCHTRCNRTRQLLKVPKFFLMSHNRKASRITMPNAWTRNNLHRSYNEYCQLFTSAHYTVQIGSGPLDTFKRYLNRILFQT